MPALLYSLGILVAVVGLLTLGFAIPLRDFDLGHSLIVTGSTALVGGLILIGLGAVVREVRRLARSLERPGLERPMPQSPRPQAEPAAAPAPGAPGRALGRMPLPTPTPPVPARDRAEPRLDLPAGGEGMPEPPRRPDILAAIRNQGREPAMPETENVPLSPTLTPRAPMPPRQEAHEPQHAAGERRPQSPANLASRTARRLDTPPPPAEPARGLPRSERPARNLFDTVWPTDPRRAGEPERSAPEPEPPRMLEQPFILDEPPEVAPPPPRAEEPAREPPRPSEPATILKSGVIDGMAYTLYTDGSIEAQLPKGLMRFASIDELRNYLENNG